MANYDHYLSVPDKRQSPIELIRTGEMTGLDHFRVFSPDLFGIPQMWKLKTFRIALTCSVDVGNRYIKLLRYSKQFVAPLNSFYRDAMAASASNQWYMVDGSWNASAAGFGDAIIGSDGLSMGVGNQLWNDFIISGGFVGDLWYAIIEYEYMNRQWGMKEVLPEE